MSGNGELKEASWYDRILAAVEEGDNPLLIAADNLAAVLPEVATEIDATLLRPLPTGQRQGIGLHTLLQHLSASSPDTSVLLTADGIKRERGLTRLRYNCSWTSRPATKMINMYACCYPPNGVLNFMAARLRKLIYCFSNRGFGVQYFKPLFVYFKKP